MTAVDAESVSQLAPRPDRTLFLGRTDEFRAEGESVRLNTPVVGGPVLGTAREDMSGGCDGCW
ncbi:hypothetical protein NRB20_46120 [Nocardia sp. RB20]|uniref:Uncharacterized protein n=1 Tax=Nocardia macrotermitis TaxID=2585198 RepID=A0A7K0D6W4_9NOCA|nr:hypothetical protein [Nocardia macrotermitis]